MATKDKNARVPTLVLEAVVNINPRGRSVVTGTLLEEGVSEIFKLDLNDAEKARFENLIVEIAGAH